jgi:hypothetical protein
MHPDLLESLVRDRITELRGGRSHRSMPSMGARSLRRATAGRARVGRLFVRVGTSLIGDGVGRAARPQARPAPACSTR